ncbi:Na(+)/H(+) antiporter subunit C [Corynebacterium capitovis DSM 44611]|uniref:Na(+)/H(+) antiporter subunit C n=1 Tax=Corynebacterium capitovis TaxID=131081 RepID=UPI0003603ABE|nr:Na(+)/H(+) antiporter subunit C [Corynebacterium capitovis]WKD58196.1 Na(+)/H(+) antiporter subunit C [Corynebacterium capitovis DSM 44611]
MEANLFLLIGAGVLVTCGVYLMLDKSMTRMILGVLLLGNGANLLLLQAGGQAGSPPVLERESTLYGDHIADPLAQGMVLTAIVISMAMVAFMLALAYRQYRYRTVDVIERDEEDVAVASRPANTSVDSEEPGPTEAERAQAIRDSVSPRTFRDSPDSAMEAPHD